MIVMMDYVQSMKGIYDSDNGLSSINETAAAVITYISVNFSSIKTQFKIVFKYVFCLLLSLLILMVWAGLMHCVPYLIIIRCIYRCRDEVLYRSARL